MLKVRKSRLLILGWVAISCLFIHQAKAQELPIFLDGRFDDWFNINAQYQDNEGDSNGFFGIDLLDFSMSNNKDYLLVRLKFNQNIKLVEDNDLFLYLDTDDNSQTGKIINGIGAEIGIHFGNRSVQMYPSNSVFTYDFNRIDFRNLPTVSGFEHEIAISRYAVMPDNNTPIFSNSSLKAVFKDESSSNGDFMPNLGNAFRYTFEDNPVEPVTPSNLEKEQDHYLRLMTYNTLQNGLIDGSRVGAFRRIFEATQPDVITFNECWDVSAGQVKNLLDNVLPLNNTAGWQTVKIDGGNITASRYPILRNWQVITNRRLTASLIDLPSDLFPTDILVVNAHFKCCGEGDAQRQTEADAFASFILDAKTIGERIDLPENTPFVLSGDLNLVGQSQQLKTLIEGDIVSTFAYGEGAPLDWDATDLEDIYSPQTGDYAAFTWLGEFSNFPAGRLDFMIHSNSVMEVKKAYTINTLTMSPQNLDYYNLRAEDTRDASDHLPKVTDFELANPTNIDFDSSDLPLQLKITPNPFFEELEVVFQLTKAEDLQWQIFNMNGQKVWEVSTNQANGNFRLSSILEVAGVYMLKVSDSNSQKYQVRRLLKL